MSYNEYLTLLKTKDALINDLIQILSKKNLSYSDVICSTPQERMKALEEVLHQITFLESEAKRHTDHFKIAEHMENK